MTAAGFAGWSATERGRRQEASGGDKGKKAALRNIYYFFNVSITV